MDMPVINSCAAERCAYNVNRECHALAITVGDSHQAVCETFFDVALTGGDSSSVGHVGACKMANCGYNVDLECQAPGVSVDFRGDVVSCVTFQPTPSRQPA